MEWVAVAESEEAVAGRPFSNRRWQPGLEVATILAPVARTWPTGGA